MSTKPSVYDNALAGQLECEKATLWAGEQLLSQGIVYPTKRLYHSIESFYDAVREYGEKEASLVRRYFMDRRVINEPIMPKMKKRKLIPAKPIAVPYYD